jgi:uncharacterized protein YdeI (YjbR/CyaY-like superfamily)
MGGQPDHKEITMSPMLYVTTRDEWRQWLEENHDSEHEVWLIFYKKHTCIPGILYNDAVEEALCYGWIDSIVKRVDDEKFVRKFTPRRKNSRWSQLNKNRARKMIKEGKMTEAGLAKIDEPMLHDNKNADENEPLAKKELVIPPDIDKALKAHQQAWENFTSLAPGYKRQYIGWVVDAKREKTRKRRLKELITVLEKNERLGMK